MLLSMFPAVRGTSARKARCILLAFAGIHSLGSVLAAAAMGGLLALVSTVVARPDGGVRPWFAALAIGLCLLYLPRVLGWSNFPPLLQSTRQVPSTWAMTYRGWRVALFFGLALGSGLYTRIVVPTYYLLFIWPFLGVGPLWTVAIWATYGFSRTLNAWWLAWTADPDNPLVQAANMNQATSQRTSWMLRANALVMLVAILLATRGLL